jgi:hypothetical protein
MGRTGTRHGRCDRLRSPLFHQGILMSGLCEDSPIWRCMAAVHRTERLDCIHPCAWDISNLALSIRIPGLTVNLHTFCSLLA